MFLCEARGILEHGIGVFGAGAVFLLARISWVSVDWNTPALACVLFVDLLKGRTKNAWCQGGLNCTAMPSLGSALGKARALLESPNSGRVLARVACWRSFLSPWMHKRVFFSVLARFALAV